MLMLIKKLLHKLLAIFFKTVNLIKIFSFLYLLNVFLFLPIERLQNLSEVKN